MPSVSFTLSWSSASMSMPMTINYSESYNGATANTSSITINSLTFGDWTSTSGGGGTIYNGAAIYGNILVNGSVAVNVDDIPRFRGPTTVNVSGSAVAVPHNANGSGAFSFSFSGFYMSISDFSPGNKWYPTESSKTVSLTTRTRNFTLWYSAGTGSSISVSRNGSWLSSGATITYGDVLNVGCSASTGYYLTSNPQGTYTVTGDVSLSSAASVLSYTLTMSVGAHSTMTVSRTNSPLKGAATGQLNSGATIYYNDVLSVTCSAATGFHLTTNPAGTKTVTSNITVTSASAVDEFQLAITKDSHVTVTVNRTSSPNGGAATGTVGNNATVYYGDVLKVTFSPSAGYKVVTSTSNGTMISSGANVTTTSNVILVFATDVLAVVHICDGSEFKMYLVEIVKNGEFRLYQPHIYDGNAWKPYM